ncbi:MAG: hypothetical protein CVV50_04265 [Spirochaetae bacterium HGW-Spirochaetae-6]|nr:MAG: hypothetical protein CVV50_04265 [Spirochaetae bacterium HGW-Spirochaetae-6]
MKKFLSFSPLLLIFIFCCIPSPFLTATESISDKKPQPTLVKNPIPFPSQSKAQKADTPCLPRPGHKKVLFTRSFAPFFMDHSTVPYALKLQLEQFFPQLKKLLAQPGAYLRIKGFTSPKEWTNNKKYLARLRAKAVSRYLVWKGKLSKSRIRLQGTTAPSKEGKKARRVTIQVIRG